MQISLSHARIAVFATLVLACMLGGCRNAGGPSELDVAAGDYDRTFEAAVNASREAGYEPLLQDRRSGIIETDTQIAASLLEPWRYNETSSQRLTESTVALQRTFLRIEFVDPNRASLPANSDTPDLLGLDGTGVDLTNSMMPLQLQVRAFVEHAHRPGERRSQWSRRISDEMQIVDPKSGRTYSTRTWTPIGRDIALEAAIAEDIVASASGDR